MALGILVVTEAPQRELTTIWLGAAQGDARNCRTTRTLSLVWLSIVKPMRPEPPLIQAPQDSNGYQPFSKSVCRNIRFAMSFGGGRLVPNSQPLSMRNGLTPRENGMVSGIGQAARKARYC